MDINISKFLDSTYLKTSKESGISESDTQVLVEEKIKEAIEKKFACIMIRPRFVSIAKGIISNAEYKPNIGTVIDFPLGQGTTEEKVEEAECAIINGADEIDFVCDYNAFKRGSIKKFVNDILQGTKVGINNCVIVKWIIETGALSKDEIRDISIKIVEIVQSKFPESCEDIYIKTSTGYYSGYGATVKDVRLIKSVIGKLKIKASGGIKSLNDCFLMIKSGADRIGTSKAIEIYKEKN